MSSARLDSLGMWDAVAALPDALERGLVVPHDPATGLIRRIVAGVAEAGLTTDGSPDLEAAVSHLRGRVPQLLDTASQALRLARRLGRTMPIVYGAGPIGAAAAWRWKSACNTNAKIPAFANEIAAVRNDEICGWGQHGDMTRQVFSLVLLRHSNETEHDVAAFEVVEDVCEEVVADVHTVRAEGPNRLAELIDLVVFGEVVALELAAIAGVDPGPLPILERFT